MIRVALIGVGHWHSAFYYDPLRNYHQARLCAVSDPNPVTARLVAAKFGCPWFTDHRELLEVIRPDFVFALGPHNMMPSIGHDLLEAGVAFALEKPCGTSLQDVERLRIAAERAGLFVAVPFAFRCSDLVRTMERVILKEKLSYLSFRFIAGPPQRYIEAGCDWMLDPVQSGGGCTINLAVHFFDLFAYLTGETPIVTSALISNAGYGLEVEDYSAVVLSAGDASGVVETGYMVPAPTGKFDLRFSLRSERHYVTATSADPSGFDRIVIYPIEGTAEVISTPVSQVPYYSRFVYETLDRFHAGQTPIAGLAEMCVAMRTVEDVYRTAARNMAVESDQA